MVLGPPAWQALIPFAVDRPVIIVGIPGPHIPHRGDDTLSRVGDTDLVLIPLVAAKRTPRRKRNEAVAPLDDMPIGRAPADHPQAGCPDSICRGDHWLLIITITKGAVKHPAALGLHSHRMDHGIAGIAASIAPQKDAPILDHLNGIGKTHGCPLANARFPCGPLLAINTATEINPYRAPIGDRCLVVKGKLHCLHRQNLHFGEKEPVPLVVLFSSRWGGCIVAETHTSIQGTHHPFVLRESY